MLPKEFKKEIEEFILKNKNLTKTKLNQKKMKLCGKYKLKKIPTDIEISLSLSDKFTQKYSLITKPSRASSGVSVVAVMTKPHKCPHGKCMYCPGGVDSFFGDMPQSYTGVEPATRRAIRNDFDPYIQVFNRLEQYVVLGHVPEKIELIIMGGTFPSLPFDYQNEFVCGCFKAMNDFSKLFFDNEGNIKLEKFKKFFELPGDVNDPRRIESVKSKVKERYLKSTTNLEKQQKRNEKSKVKCVGMTIETRPDYGFLEHGNQMLKLGCTRVELGIQTTYDDILKIVERGHTIKDSIKSISELRDLGFKLNFHIMLGLPGSDEKKDIKIFKELFSNSNFKPDMLKIYPTQVIKGTKIYDLWKKGKYEPTDYKKAAKIVAEGFKFIPPYVRVMRIQRDIPSNIIEAGVLKTNLRQYVDEIIKKQKTKVNEIRAREIGHLSQKNKNKNDLENNMSNTIIDVLEYEANEGKEFFISCINKQTKTIYGFCRMRFVPRELRKEITKNTAMIRELHVYGDTAKIGEKGEVQHRGIGKKLMKKAEEIAVKNKKTKIVVISGIGVREYYKKLGYKLEGVYMSKMLKQV